MALCVVSGNVYLPNGELAVARAMVFRRSDRAIKADYLGVVLPDDVHDKTNREGFIEVALITGVYEVYARGNSDYYMGRAAVPEAATAAFSDIFTAASPVPPLPEWLLQVEEARAAAELAADEAEAAAESVAGMQGDIDQAVADSQEALGAVSALSLVAESFGIVGFTQAEMVAAAGVETGVQAALNDAGWTAAMAALSAAGGGSLQFGGKIYPFSQTLIRGQNTNIKGVGSGVHMPRSAANRTLAGTVFVFHGTGPKVHTFPGITSGELNGGWRANPDNPSEVFKTWTAYNSDASDATPATLRQFSVAVLDEGPLLGGGWSGIRLLPWRGIDGVSEYVSASFPTWGDDWDFGYVIRGAEYVYNNDFSALGPWRQAGHALMITLSTPFNGRAEQNYFENCQFEGRIGHLVRSLDVWKATAVTSNSVSIAHTAESYWPSSGDFRGSNGAAYTYSASSYSAGILTLTGVNPDPTGITHIRHGSSGLANTEYHKCRAFDLYCQGGVAPQTLGIESSGMEISGFPLRGLKLINCKTHTTGRVNTHLHQVADLAMYSCQFEGGGHLIASPLATDATTWAPQATYETRNLIIAGSNGMSDGVDLRLFLPRSAFCDEIQLYSRAGNTGDMTMIPLRDGQKLVVRMVAGGGTQFLRADGQIAFEINAAGTVIFRNGSQLNLTGGVGRINYESGQSFTLREGTVTRIQVNSGAMTSGADAYMDLGTASQQYRRNYLSDGVYIGNQRVTGPRGAAVPNAATGTEVATINAILAALRTHGLIAT